MSQARSTKVTTGEVFDIDSCICMSGTESVAKQRGFVSIVVAMAQSSGFQTWSQVDARLRRATRKLRRFGDNVTIKAPDMPWMSICLEPPSIGLQLPREFKFRCVASGDSGLRDLTPTDGRYQEFMENIKMYVDYSSDLLQAAEAVRWVMDLALAWQLDVGSVNIDFNSLDKSSPLYVGLG